MIELADYLKKPLPPYRRGSADCCAFAAGWANELVGEDVIKLPPMTFGEVRRRLRKVGLVGQVASYLEPIGFGQVEIADDGDIVVIATGDGDVVGISSEGTVVSRSEGGELFVTQEPKIIRAWRFTPPTSSLPE